MFDLKDGLLFLVKVRIVFFELCLNKVSFNFGRDKWLKLELVF